MILFLIIMYVIIRMMNPFNWFYRPYRPYGYRPFFGFRPMMFGPRGFHHHHRPPMGGPGGFRPMGGPGGFRRW
ncbi:MAG: hypothetical protein J6S49_06400 [Erysipelotrichaceae bacterium]|nr:hypothetical protein [Erysipelotrichaceae bacterium]MBO7698885.1 hypothetical protein [Erysipelotrichaceae bacterium]MBP5279071.1 hypothetical protein [Erysipelotrichaceae bacterium]